MLSKILPCAAVLLAGTLAAGCLSTPVYTAIPTLQKPDCVTSAQVPENGVLIGITASGGGSRAALFAAGAYEALGKIRVGPKSQSVLEQTSFVSSVSGGSLASAYYILRKPGHEIPVLAPDGSISELYRKFFAEFKEAMARDYENPLLFRQLFRLRWFNPAWTARSLAEILGEQYLGEKTFGELARREAMGDSPRFLVNTTLYNDGRRFVVTTLDREELRYDFIRDLQKPPGGEKLDADVELILNAKWEALQSQTAQDLKINVCNMKVASAVAGSMSFPPVIGPISFHVKDEDEYWHVGDGGLSDNTGAESLLMVFLKQLQEKKARRALIISLDSSFPFVIGGKALTLRSDGFSLINYDFSRIPSIMEERSLAYRALFFRIAQRQGHLPDRQKIGVVVLRHTDATWNEDLSDLPESCKKSKVGWKHPNEVAEHLAGVVTRLWIESECDRDLVLMSAAKVVVQNEGAIRAFLEQKESK